MKQDQNKLRIDNKSYVLLTNSDVIHFHPVLEQFLKNNKKITTKLVQESSSEIKRILNYDYENILTAASKEWMRKEGEPEDRGPDFKKRKKCMLCGTPNRWIYFIKNRVNGIELNVGSECIDHFGIDPISDKKQLELKKAATKTRLQSELNAFLPGCVRIIESSYNEMEQYPILLPHFLIEKYQKIMTHLQVFYRGYLDEKLSDPFADLKASFVERKEILSEISSYVTKNRDKPFVITKSICNELRRSGKGNLIHRLKDGFIDGNNIQFLDTPEVMRKVLPLASTFFKKYNIDLVGMDVSSHNYIFNLEGIEWNISHSTLFTLYGLMMFNSANPAEITSEKIIHLGEVANDRSVTNLLETISQKSKKVDFNIIAHNRQYNDILVLDVSSRKYFLIKLDKFLKEFKYLVLEKKDCSDKVQKYIGNLKIVLTDKKDAIEFWPYYSDFLKSKKKS